MFLQAVSSFLVDWISSLPGSEDPEGWLWETIMPLAEFRIAERRIFWMSKMVLERPPREICSLWIGWLALFKNKTQHSSWPRPLNIGRNISAAIREEQTETFLSRGIL